MLATITHDEARVPIQGQGIDLYVQTYNVHPSDGFFLSSLFPFLNYQTRNVQTRGGILYSSSLLRASLSSSLFLLRQDSPKVLQQEFSVTFFF